MTEELPIDNPYWEAIRGFASSRRRPPWNTRTVESEGGWFLRKRLIPKYTWTITDPQTVQFVAGHCTGRVIDPMAGTGYWAYLLRQFGVRVISSDANPPAEDSDANFWHPNVKPWTTIRRADAVDAATLSDTDNTLLLSWPPVSDCAYKTLSAFAGNRLIYIGENNPDACADNLFYALRDSEWTLYAATDPVQYDGVRDYVTVYDRNQPPPSS